MLENFQELCALLSGTRGEDFEYNIQAMWTESATSMYKIISIKLVKF
jgi:hypothetical protein